ncbi:ATP-dependent DNA helicase [Clostridium pasteurianum DSM 525 = ATCC 6013]|uniref:ATP-dependent DNA helicase n=2 Tax=Clostridium pasteurianum TaxID=1501 RepID=A0A0H3J8H3_CLOPA|nr:ATP-dependent DNA helicase [Clostridium pasteurianum]AJA48228.1 ATP-dependent DNA helicase [Clostridium pasteurianum DSM 525 = ATCC 6013]AJA52216.1 ATP-dependent DNA helicase [Clostridium pasteurianum DSM 525 = ATCC 6013]AOZ77347.1 ATP-dependent helicase [Clostridium pasteurianum DSM 525 = ATCC 6013]AOZ81144.1 ATP-dependent helicase [Clostridium pasteurianum]KRU11774.1 helicase c2 [Clostridium pasteurianum DSM 525 = ATCC 6013]
MSSITNIKVSVRDLIEFVLRSGDLIFTFSGGSRNIDAIKIHQKIQNSSGDNYNSEVSISYIILKDNISLEINGRIDGVIIGEKNIIIDEIKTTTNDLDNINEDYNDMHWAQVKCYAYFYCVNKNLNTIDTRLTYYQMDSGAIKYLLKSYSIEELEKFFMGIIDKYIYWAKLQKNWIEVRDSSIKRILFPYGEYRLGQRKLAVAVYTSIKENKKIFIKAPTGIGKTMSTIFPACKALGEGIISKIFYATSKNITGKEVEKAFTLLNKKGLEFKVVWITAKDKICFNEERNCNPDLCDYAKGHFDRVNNALKDILNENIITREVIEKYSSKYRVCPFELSLDLTDWCDCVVCDYNYIFDPKVYLRRFFSEEGGDYCLLVDEAHNLVDRARDMYSAELYKKDILSLKNKCKGISSLLYKSLNKINSYFIQEREKCEKNNLEIEVEKTSPKEIIPLLKSFIYQVEKFLAANEKSVIKEDILEIYFTFNSFIRAYEIYNDKYVTYRQKLKDEVLLKIFCIDTSEVIGNCIKKAKAVVFFSATLTPMNYFIYLLGGDKDSYRINLPSPFKRENLCLLLDDSVSTKYINRKYSYKNIISIIYRCITERKGNYFVFFPSYVYMKSVFDIFCERYSKINVICQKNSMNEDEKNSFLRLFSEKNEETLIGFAVMGGVFSEGIDLAGEKLIGAIIVGVGLPKISLERNLIKEYFNENKRNGFLYSYVYPGINKVLQSAGRVIRTESDKGIIVLIDERYSENTYKKLLPAEWASIININNITKNLNNVIREFWYKE